jgi:hypothetical protein
LLARAWNIPNVWNNCGFREFKSDADTFRHLAAKDRVFSNLVIVVAHVPATPSKPEIAKTVRTGRVVPQIGIAESAEGMKAAPFDAEFFLDRVQLAAQYVALPEWFSIARAENVSGLAARNEVGDQLRHVGTEINGAIGIRCFGCLSLASPHGLLDFDTSAIEVPNFKANQFTGAKPRRRIDNNPTIGLAILERTGVSAHRGERMQMPEATDGYSRQAIMIANVSPCCRPPFCLELGGFAF